MIYLCRLVLRFLDFLSGMLTKLYINARFQNSDFVFKQLKPGINFVRHAAKKVTKPRKSRRAKIYHFLFGRLTFHDSLSNTDAFSDMIHVRCVIGCITASGPVSIADPDNIRCIERALILDINMTIRCM